MKAYQIQLFIKTELKRRNMRKVELVVLNQIKQKCGCSTILGKIFLDKSWLKLWFYNGSSQR